MTEFALRLYDDRLGVKVTVGTPVANCVIYVIEGMASVSASARAATLSANSAWFSADETMVASGSDGVRHALSVAGRFHRRDKGIHHPHRAGRSMVRKRTGPGATKGAGRPAGLFSRVMILPRALLGKRSLTYVNPEDTDKPKLQHYTILIDECITI